jgi:hypothetical protein
VPKMSVGGGPGHAVRAHADRGVRPTLAGPRSPVPPPAARSPAWPGPRRAVRPSPVRTAAWGRAQAPDIAGNGSRPAEPAGAGSGHLPTSCRYFFEGW